MSDEETCNGHAIEVLGERIEALSKLMDERDKRYGQSFRESKDAVSAALQAAKEQTQASFAASEKAISKAEASQLQYNVGHNDLTRKMDMQYKEMLPRPEADNRFKAIEEKLADLRESRSQSGGRGEGLNHGWLILLGFLSLVGMVLGIVSFFKH